MLLFTVVWILFEACSHFTVSSPNAEPSLKFLVLADWGGIPFFPYKTFVEMNIAREIADVSDKFKTDFILALGDNFYFKGVENVYDPRFKETFETAFNYTSLNIPWFVVAGNHDHYGNISAQILYSSKSERWKFPDYYYKIKYKVPQSDATMDILMIDTVILCGNTEMTKDSQPVLDPAFKKQSQTHWKWLEKSLQSSKANYVIVCGHYPVYSVGSHGSTKCLVEHLNPLLEKYNVTAYFSGHEHNMQHIQRKKSDFIMDYFVSGCANFIDPSKKHEQELPPDSKLLYHWGNPLSLGAFISVDVSVKNMRISFLSSFGKEMYSYSKSPRF